MLKLPSYIKDYYFLNSYLNFSNCSKLPLTLNSRTITYQMFSDYDTMLDLSKIELHAPSAATLYVHYNRDLKADAYHLSINYKKQIIIESSSRRGIRYALALLCDLVNVIDNDVYVPIIQVDDAPSFPHRGIIEGFYGKPWTHNERLDEVDVMNRLRMNTYIYAPKDDEYHRKLWSKLYPDQELSQLLELKDKCNLFDIDFMYCISPGIDFDYCDESNFSFLFAKLNQVIDQGVKQFGILMDDIDYKLKGKNKERFIRPGIAHAYICNRVNSYLKDKVFNHKLVMCPTEYHQNQDGIYRHDLSDHLDKDIAIFFTGDAVCAEVIDERVIKQVRHDFGHPLYIWENHPVNDFLPSRLFTGPILNRARKMGNYADAYITNPMNQWVASRIGIASCAYYAWNSEGYNPEIVYNEVIENEFEDLMPDIKVFFAANRATVVDYYENQKFKRLVNKGDYQALLEFYHKLELAVNNLLKSSDKPLIVEITPWLNWSLVEASLVRDIINGKLSKEAIIEKLEDKHRLGVEIIDYLVEKLGVLTKDEYDKLIKARRGNLWWRVWEEKR